MAKNSGHINMEEGIFVGRGQSQSTSAQEKLQHLTKEQEEQKIVFDEARKMVIDADKETEPFYKDLEKIKTEIDVRIDKETEIKKIKAKDSLEKIYYRRNALERMSKTDEKIKELLIQKKRIIADIYEIRDRFIVSAIKGREELSKLESRTLSEDLRVRILDEFLKRMNQFIGGEDGGRRIEE